MSNLIVHGGTPLRGRVIPSANKNAVLPILCATLLTDQPLRLHGVPDITDVRKILDIFRTLGSEVRLDESTRTLDLHHRDTTFDAARHRLPEEMRSSIMLVSPLLARFGVARLEDNVKGCTLGVREIDPHVDIFRSFGGEVERASGSLLVRSAGPLKPTHHWLDYASVTTTENFVLCAAAAAGESTLTNAASEPHVQEFCRFMTMMGANIDGIGTSRLTVRGGATLRGGEFTFEEDFHEITTFLALGAITGGDVVVRNSTPSNFPLIDRTFAKFGVRIVHENGWSRALRDGPLKVQTPFTSNVLTKVEAAPWPYFPVDLLPIFIALGVCAEGNAMFWNKVYDGALGWTGELSKFGAHVFSSDPHRVITFGGNPLTPAVVESPYIIRVAIALFMIASSIEGRSEIRNATPIRRAHPRFVENLRSLGVQVEWTAEE
ncbi:MULTISPECIES: UDP-N-acetylglucosamine 1-carboxyvinyltransferase [Achromobacter]|uniref:UDP-N-acetylglucosamine 1-carboxyvinyltransferase n=1 Tax=Achromobacter dolens TaxID=1287738 RepID=A0A6S7CG48_9BURK|nr:MULTISPECIES: UDP-N-acetylglucosamine 1-carboxyvinyltransferase [Achromobacter]AHC48042.1 UDP-N-acetylglucosamine 1-carboxyvinyltransferase [Achromobacter xylosoxidans NBRC 15126 = ATCC 27061]AXA78364.1 UDP-N-acetylglucosamine 1-carboxyvinyltransferase [Achromobacter xylosoxidans]NYS11925.1 UDP-N-acetylglucosamine 1-carboxyvinyltransferase [Achromobacter xylosoxidans]OFQ45353.1 UDP-N-acetylglucosamine 1-carboxyvinyltransferase [Achromobacter xylosoxidans]PNM89230.1 UDP-N-acetylglucosamine 1